MKVTARWFASTENDGGTATFEIGDEKLTLPLQYFNYFDDLRKFMENVVSDLTETKREP